MKKLIFVLALLIGLAVAAETHTIKTVSFGCVDQEDQSRLAGYLADGDTTLFESELKPTSHRGIHSTNCIILAQCTAHDMQIVNASCKKIPCCRAHIIPERA